MEEKRSGIYVEGQERKKGKNKEEGGRWKKKEEE